MLLSSGNYVKAISLVVISGSGCAEHQATGALPQPSNPTAGPHRLKTRRRTRQHPPQPAQDGHQSQSFSTTTGVSTSVRLLNPFGHGIVGNPVTFIGVSLNSQILV